jgi:ketosteroid isomerase-like protein
MSSTTNTAEIEALFQKLAKAHADHYADAMVEVYAPDAVIYDLDNIPTDSFDRRAL